MAKLTAEISEHDFERSERDEPEMLTTVTESERPDMRSRLGPLLILVASILLWAAIITMIAQVI